MCTFTRDPPNAVARALERLRDVADEIVAVVDAGAPDSDPTPLRDVCDRVIVAPFVWPLEANLAWLEDQCTGEWMLRIDGDEVPSAALAERLAEPSWRDGVTHVFVARRWLWDDTRTMLDQAPWWLDPQCRLIRRGAAAWPTIGAGAHDMPKISGASRLLVEPIYHLDLLVTNRDDRLARARRYEASSPGLVTADGVNQNIGFYVPEARDGSLRTTPVPDVDRAVLDDVIAAFDTPGSPTVDHCEAVVVREDPMPGRGDAEVDVFAAPDGPFVEGSTMTVAVTVSNRSGRPWSHGDRSPVCVGARIRDHRGATIGPEARTALPTRVMPGRSEIVTVHVGPMPHAGKYILSIGALREGVAWFEPTLDMSIDVVRPPRVLVASGISPQRHLGDDLIVATVLDALALHAIEMQVILLADDPDTATRRFGVPATTGAAPLLTDVAGGSAVLRRLEALRRDATRVGAGGHAEDPTFAALLDQIAAADVLIVLGAGWLTSRHRRAGLLTHLFEVEAARAMGVPVVFEAGSVGPLDGIVDRFAARRLLSSAEVLSVRDTASLRTVRRLGIRGARLTPDIATAHPSPATTEERDRSLRRAGVDPGRPFAVLSLRGGSVDRDDIDRYAAVVTLLSERDLPTLFLAHHTAPAGDDRNVATRLSTRVPIHALADMPPDRVAASVIEHAACTVGDRFHLAVLSARVGTPGLFVTADEYDRHRGHAFDGTSVRACTPDDVTAALTAVLDDPLGAPMPRWDAARFATEVAAIARRPGRPRPAPRGGPVVRIGSPRRSDGGHRVRVDVDGAPVTLRCDDVTLDPIPEALAGAFAFPASAAHRRLSVPGPIDPGWLAGAQRNVAIAHDWFAGAGTLELDVRRAPLSRRFARLADRQRSDAADGVALCFTGGVDSFHMLLTSSVRPTHLLFVAGFDIDLSDDERLGQMHTTLTEVGVATGTTPIVVTTDLRPHPLFASLSWEFTHGAALATIGHLLHDTIGTLLIAPSYPTNRLRPWGSRPDLDPNWGIPGGLRIIHGDTSISRSDRLAEIADDPTVQGHLRVCWQNVPGALNCGRCEKCVRTMTCLAGLGRLEAFTTFPDRDDLVGRLDALAPLAPQTLAFWEDLETCGFRDAEREALEALLARSHALEHEPLS